MAEEKNFENRIKRHMKSVGAWGFKFFASGFTRSGIPDLNYCYRGRYIAIEVKAADGKPSTLQIVTARKIREAGGLSVILYPGGFETFKKILINLDKRKSYEDIPILLKGAFL